MLKFFNFLFFFILLINTSLSQDNNLIKFYKKIDFFSKALIGKKFIKTDPDLNISNLDEFNCVTYVEAVLAFADSNCGKLSLNCPVPIQNLIDNKYFNDYDLSISNRRHFFVLDFLHQFPDRFENKVFEFAKNQDDIEEFEFKINKRSFLKNIYNLKNKEIESIRDEVLKMDYLKIDKLKNEKKLLSLIGDDVYLVIFNSINLDREKLRKIKTYTDLDALHVGFIMKFKGKIIMRHAQVTEGAVSEVNFFEYLNLKFKSGIFDYVSFFKIYPKTKLDY